MRHCEPKRRRIPGWRTATAVAFLGSALSSQSSSADEIYRWIAEDGSVHYSDSKPVDGAPVTVIEIETAFPRAYNPEDDPYSILNQAARAHRRWLDLEEARRARVEEQREAPAYRPQPPSDYGYHEYDGYLEYSSFYPYYAYWPANGSGFRPGQGREQIYAMNTLDLLGPRPSSINSGAHQDRVFRSQFLPLVPPPPVVRPVPR